MNIQLDTRSIEDYRRFLRIKSLPQFSFVGGTAVVPDEYADRLGCDCELPASTKYAPSAGLWDYQRDIARLAIQKRKFCVFADCGLGKTLIFLEFARHAMKSIRRGQCVLIVSPLMVVEQTLQEAAKFYGDLMPIRQVRANELAQWLTSGSERIGITNYDALDDDTPRGRIGCLILDESSMLKSHYGKWGTKCIEMGRGVEWKMACTGTPAPNDRIEYANHAVFMDAYPTTNSFLSRFFVNRGQTDNRWELKPHALEPFYRSLSHWCIFLTNPATYGWKDNCGNIPPIHVHIHDVGLTQEQTEIVMARTNGLFVHNVGGIGSRSFLAQVAKGSHAGRDIGTLKPEFIRNLVSSWPNESTIIWCIYNAEQETMRATFPNGLCIDGDTPYEDRRRMIAEFKSGANRVLISKPKILGFGLNLQVCTRQVFSGLQDSYESYYQAVKRSNRVGSAHALNVHIPVTDVERPMVETVLEKAHRVQSDTEEQERIFKRLSTEAVQ